MRFYEVEGRRLPSVTTILEVTKPTDQQAVLHRAIAKNPARAIQRRDEARRRGIALHKWVESTVAGRSVSSVDFRLDPYIKHLRPWLSQFERVSASEQVIWDSDVGYAGTLDLIVTDLENRMTLIDLKTNRHQAYPPAVDQALLQCAAYAAAWNKRQHALKVGAIAAVFISPYKLEPFIRQGFELDGLIREFYGRVRQFGTRVSELQT